MIQYIIQAKNGTYVEVASERPMSRGTALYSPSSNRLYEGLGEQNILRGLPAMEVFDRLTVAERCAMRGLAKLENDLGAAFTDFLHRFDLGAATGTPVWMEPGSNFYDAITLLASPGIEVITPERAAEILSLD